jgi:SAM-dependent methyltransferase
MNQLSEIAAVQPPAAVDRCKLCGSPAPLRFGLPLSKKTGHPIPDEPDSAFYYQCETCDFLFTRALDGDDHREIYDATYWDHQDPDWYGRVAETLRLCAFGNELLGGRLDSAEILDFGCGIGGFLDMAHRSLALKAWGTDIIPPKVGGEWFLPELGDRKFDIIVACEVIEHLPDPRATFATIRRHLKSPGVFAFQTAYWDPEVLDRDWWYLGPDNGHISLFSAGGLTHLFEEMGGRARRLWNNYAGLQAWRFG